MRLRVPQSTDGTNSILLQRRTMLFIPTFSFELMV